MIAANFNPQQLTQSVNLNWSISTIVILLLAGAPFLGMIVGESRLKRTMNGAFAGIAVALVATGPIWHWLEPKHLSYVTESRISLLLFGITILLMNIGPLPHHQTSHRFSLRVMVLSFLLMTMLISSVLLFLPAGTAAKLIAESPILAFFDKTRVAWIVAAAIWVMIMNLAPGPEKMKK